MKESTKTWLEKKIAEDKAFAETDLSNLELSDVEAGRWTTTQIDRMVREIKRRRGK